MPDSITPWSLEAALYELSKFNDEYKSFITDKEYLVYIKESDSQLIIDRASGLLRDAAATTTRLLREGKFDEVDQHRYAQSYLAALAMFYCYKRSSKKGDIFSDVYSNILETVKQALKDNEFEKLNLGELLRKKYNRIINKQNYVNRKAAEKFASLTATDEDGKEYDVVADVLQGVGYGINWHRFQNLINTLIFSAVDEKIIDEDEAQIICYSFGLGEGFDKTANKDIAEKMGIDCTPSNITQRRKKALRQLEEFAETLNDGNDFHELLAALGERYSERTVYELEETENPFWNEGNNI